MNLEVTSASKAAEPLSDAAAAIFVITREDILRSGATSIPEMLRLAPNLQVMRVSASNYIITARGFTGNSADQNFPDKLLVLIERTHVGSPNEIRAPMAGRSRGQGWNRPSRRGSSNRHRMHLRAQARLGAIRGA